MKNTSNQIDLYEKVTDKIIEQMEQGRIPWQQPWKGGMQAISHSSGKAYSFLNQMLLGFKGGEWLTFNQCKKEGGSIRKGEHSSTVVFWQTSYLKNMTVEDADGTEKTVKILVAEMGAAFMLAKLGIDCEKAFTNSVAYLQGWLRALKNDKKMIVVAAGKAEAAVEYILTGKKNEKKETGE